MCLNHTFEMLAHKQGEYVYFLDTSEINHHNLEIFDQ